MCKCNRLEKNVCVCVCVLVRAGVDITQDIREEVSGGVLVLSVKCF